MAVRIAGVTLPNEKRIEVALTYLYGVGLSRSKLVLEKTKVSPNTRVKNLTDEEVHSIRTVIEKEYHTEGDLRREIMTNIKRLKEIGSYRGSRHAKHLPARGQRTKTNNRTVRGNKRMTATSGKKPSAQKT